jgi:hypothetical protein
MELGQGENRLASVNEFREKTGCMPDADWSDIYECLAGELEFW